MKPAIYKRIIFNNIYVEKGEYIMLMNMISFRRRIITKEELMKLRCTMEKIKCGGGIDEREDDIYIQLENEKQILSDSIINKVDEYHKSNAKMSRNKIAGIKMDISYKCNLNCQYCYERSFKNNQGTINKTDVDKILEFVKKFNQEDEVHLKNVSINGGEPLLNENVGLINYILSAVDSKAYMLFTNGINIIKYKEAIDFSKFTQIQISLDGDDEAISNISNKELHVFERIIEGIKYVMKFENELIITCLFTPGIAKRILKFVELLKLEGIFDMRSDIKITVGLPYKAGADGIDHEFISLDEYIDLKNIIMKDNLGKYVQLDSFINISRLSAYLNREINLQMDRKISVCSGENGYNFTFGPGGRVYWCQCQNPESAIIANYYTGEVYNEVFNELVNRSIFSVPECRECELRYFCGTGCPMSLLADNESKNRPACNDFWDEEIVNRLEEIL